MSFEAAGTVLSIVGNLKAGSAAKKQGLAQQAAAEYEAAQQRIEAKQALAASQRDAMEERRQGELVQSRAIALAAASGGGVTDPTIVTLLARNAGETAYRSAVALYKGEEEARRRRAAAAGASYSGQTAAEAGRDRQKAYTIAAFSDMVGNKSLMARFGGGGPPAEQAPAPVFDRLPTLTGNG